MNQEMLKRIKTIKTDEVENELPRIHIDSEGALFQLMSWRNVHKDLVRNISPIAKEGIISTGLERNYFYYLVEGDEVYLMNKVSNEEYLAIIYNMEDSTVKEIANTITFYPKEEAIHDVLTVYATCMAYLNHLGIKIKERETFTINQVTL